MACPHPDGLLTESSLIYYYILIPMQINELKPGDKIPASSFTLEPNKIKDYIEAVEESSGYFSQWSPGVIAPPVACVSLAIAALFNNMKLPDGTVHTSQEITLNRPIKVGERLLCQASMVRNQARRRLRIMTLRLEINDEDGERVLEGETSLVITEQESGVS